MEKKAIAAIYGLSSFIFLRKFKIDSTVVMTKHETQFLIENPELVKTRAKEYKLLGLEVRQFKILLSRLDLSGSFKGLLRITFILVKIT